MTKKKKRMARTVKNIDETTSQRLSSLIKSARDIMRKDKGLNGDLDRLPMLTWVMFLKFLDDMERISQQEAEISGQRFRPAVEPPYRWRDWAAQEDGTTGDELLAFINQDEAVRPDGTRGPHFRHRQRLPADGGAVYAGGGGAPRAAQGLLVDRRAARQTHGLRFLPRARCRYRHG